MMNDIIENLTNYAMDLGYGVELNPLLKPDVPSFVSNKRQLIVINTNTKVQEEIPLQLAHEIGHVLNNDRKLNKYYYTYAKYGVEKDANVMALILLVPYYTEDKRKSTSRWTVLWRRLQSQNTKERLQNRFYSEENKNEEILV